MAFGEQTDPTELDPLFYRGRTPVLGRPVEVRAAGTLPTDFPQAVGSPPVAPTPPTFGPPPTPPPGELQFSFTMPEFPGIDVGPEPTPPMGPPGLSMPAQPTPSWWQRLIGAGVAGLDVTSKAADAYTKLRKTGDVSAEGAAEFTPPPWLAPSETGLFNVMGPADQPALDASKFSLYGSGAEPALNPADYSVLGADPAAPTLGAGGGGGIPGVGAALPFIQTGLGAYGLATADTTRGRVLSGANTASGALMTLEALGMLSPALAPIAPALALASIPLIVGPLIDSLRHHDEANWPMGYRAIPGQNNAAIDPTTGAVLWYLGRGRYDWSPETKAGVRATPDQFREWKVTPSGDLLKNPAYRSLLPSSADLAQSFASQGMGALANLDPSQQAALGSELATAQANFEAPFRAVGLTPPEQGPTTFGAGLEHDVLNDAWTRLAQLQAPPTPDIFETSGGR